MDSAAAAKLSLLRLGGHADQAHAASELALAAADAAAVRERERERELYGHWQIAHTVISARVYQRTRSLVISAHARAHTYARTHTHTHTHTHTQQVNNNV